MATADRPAPPSAPHRVADLARYLLGRWRVARDVADPAGGLVGRFLGEATVVERATGLLVYEEEGELVLGAHRGTARRGYRYLLTGPGTAEVCFRDGRHFHDLDLRRGRDDVVHHCGADIYLGTVLARGEDDLETRWRIVRATGEVLLTSRLARVRPGASTQRRVVATAAGR